MCFGYAPKPPLFSTGTLRATSTNNLHQYTIIRACLKQLINKKNYKKKQATKTFTTLCLLKKPF